MKRQSLSTTTVLFRTTFTRTIKLNLLFIMFFVCHPKILHKHCFQFLLGVKMAPRETENNAYAKRTIASQWASRISCSQSFEINMYLLYFSGSENKPKQLRRMVWLPAFDGERSRARRCAGSVWKSNSKCPPCWGKATVEAIHLPVD